jgi:predicted short-subunit dehydrogenase-like oxidoreductase (DUF2520 family)
MASRVMIVISHAPLDDMAATLKTCAAHIVSCCSLRVCKVLKKSRRNGCGGGGWSIAPLFSFTSTCLQK